MSCNQDCNQGRACPCRKDQDGYRTWCYVRDFFAIVGFCLMVGFIAFIYGFKHG